jgi:putative hydrolase
MTHAWQFAAHPWLRGHLNSMLAEVLALAGDSGREPFARLMSMTVGLPRQWRTVRRMQATMSLVEGYSNLVMNLAGRRLLRRFDDLEEAYRRRSAQRGVLESLFWKVTGLDLKLQQYERGERFARAIHDRHGMEALNRAWESPEHLPRLHELDDPEEWYRRVSKLAVAS